MFGPDQPVIFHLIEVPEGMKRLQGCVMEIKDGGFPLLKGIVATDNLEQGFGDVDYAVFVGAKPRSKGMERKDLMSANAKIFATQGKALNSAAKKDVKALVVGNPANTNALVLSANAPDIPPGNIMAMTRLDQNRAMGMLAEKANVPVRDVERVVIWGNHSTTQYPDISHAIIAGKPGPQVITDKSWLDGTFLPSVQQRGAAILAARGASSATSAGSAAIDHIRDMFVGSGEAWQSMGIPSDGSYDIEPGLWYSVPVTCGNGSYQPIAGLSIDERSRAKMVATMTELKEERDAVLDLLPSTYGKAGAKKAKARKK
mmetsp:Transcript_41871/g.103056  ORF Transcript_41871/g.103056 Transcript_41871/m.103056 type:complete len:315 (-) Transcript_41871:170-1114(-)